MLHLDHPRLTRRATLQAGAIGLLGLGMNHLAALQAAGKSGSQPKAKAVIYIFLSGGLSQIDSFDMKPDAPDSIRGEFKPIATQTPGVQICEHLPELAKRSNHWALVRSLTHPSNDHSQGHAIMLSGQSQVTQGFDPNKPRSTDWPSIASMTMALMPPRNNLPPAVVLPEKLIHRTGRVIPGQFGGLLGSARDPWFVDACRYNTASYGAYGQYGFHHERGREDPADFAFQAPSLSLPADMSSDRFRDRVRLLGEIGRQQGTLERMAENEAFDRHRQRAISLLADRQAQSAFDVTRADEKTQERYGRNSFGWSLLMAKRLVESGVSLVQVNLGNNESWDTHQRAFTNLKNFLFPPTDRAVSALLDDLQASGLLDSTLVVMAGEFGRTPRVASLPGAKQAGRDHWGGVQTAFFAGGGVRGGAVIGTSDKIGAYPATNPQQPENMAATIYQALGIPRSTEWHDITGRPHQVYSGEPIPDLVS